MNMLIIFLKLVSFITLSEAENVFYFQPEQIHIAFGENVSEIMVNWSTKDFTDSIVEYGINGLWKRAEGNSTKFVDGGPLKASQFIHRVTLKNLENSSRYVYHCGSDLGWSDMLYFHTVPNGSDWAPRLAVYGDMGNENPQSLPRLQQDVVHHRYDMVLHVGDFGYDMHDENGAVGDEFMRQIQPIAAHVPYMVAVGNHEAAYNFSHYKARFSMPRTSDNMFYSFDLGPAHFIGFSTEVYYDTWISSESHIASMVQYERLENDLKEATKPENRSKRPWIITFGHRPMYCSNSDRDDCTHSESRVRTGFQDQKGYGLEDLFYKYGVDLELWAHEHSYERLWPVYNHQVYNGSWNLPYTNPRAPVHIITGSAGCKEKIDGFMDNPRGWSAFRSSDYGYTRMQVHNATHLYLEQVSDDLDGDIIDHVWLIKNKHGPYALHEEIETMVIPKIYNSIEEKEEEYRQKKLANEMKFAKRLKTLKERRRKQREKKMKRDGTPQKPKVKVITRKEWAAQEPTDILRYFRNLPDLIRVVSTGTPTCEGFWDCCAAMQTIQDRDIELKYGDIRYNFVVSSDGIVFEGRSWDIIPHIIGAKFRSRCLVLGIAGEFKDVMPPKESLRSIGALMTEAVEESHIQPNFKILPFVSYHIPAQATLETTQVSFSEFESLESDLPDFDFKEEECDNLTDHHHD